MKKLVIPGFFVMMILVSILALGIGSNITTIHTDVDKTTTEERMLTETEARKKGISILPDVNYIEKCTVHYVYTFGLPIAKIKSSDTLSFNYFTRAH